MDYSHGTLARLKQQDMLREAAQRNRARIDDPEHTTRQRDRKPSFRRLLHR